MGSRYTGLLKIAQAYDDGLRNGALGRGIGMYSDFRDRHPRLGRAVDAGMRMFPGMSMAPSMPGLLNRWDRFSNDHPWTAMGASFLPVVGAVPWGLDAINDLRRGNYLSAAGNALGLGAAVFGGGAFARALGAAGKASRIGVRGATATQRVLGRVPGVGGMGRAAEQALMHGGREVTKATRPFMSTPALAGMIGLPLAGMFAESRAPAAAAGVSKDPRLRALMSSSAGRNAVPYGTGSMLDPQLPPSRYRGLLHMNPYEDPATLPFGGMPSSYWG